MTNRLVRAAVVGGCRNIIAVISDPELERIGIEQHQVWGIMPLGTLRHGPGELSIDHPIAGWLGRNKPAGRGGLASV